MRAAFVTADENYSGKRVAAVYADASMIGQRVHIIPAASIDNTSKQAAGEAVAGLMELADRYFSIGYAQGREGRKTDSPAFDALECRYEIESRIAAYTTPPRHPADEGRADALQDAVLDWWHAHMFDTYSCGDDAGEANTYDEPPEFVRIALAALQAGTP